MLDLACCAAGSDPAGAIRAAGGKAVVIPPGDPQLRDHALQPHAWTWQVADAVGLHREAVRAGYPVPLAREMSTWAEVDTELRSDRWDAIVIQVSPPQVANLLEAPELLLRIVDARLDRLAGSVGDDRTAAIEVATLLQVRASLPDLVRTANSAAGYGAATQHRQQGCSRPGGLGLASIGHSASQDREGHGVRTDDGSYIWWVVVPDGSLPELHREGDRLVVRAGEQRRTFSLPGALARCEVRAARVVGDRLEVSFELDLDEWR